MSPTEENLYHWLVCMYNGHGLRKILLHTISKISKSSSPSAWIHISQAYFFISLSLPQISNTRSSNPAPRHKFPTQQPHNHSQGTYHPPLFKNPPTHGSLQNIKIHLNPSENPTIPPSPLLTNSQTHHFGKKIHSLKNLNPLFPSLYLPSQPHPHPQCSSTTTSPSLFPPPIHPQNRSTTESVEAIRFPLSERRARE